VLVEKLAYRLTPDARELPPIFHYWSNRWLRPRFEALGFQSPEDFFCRQVAEIASRAGHRRLSLLSLGSGNAIQEAEIVRFLKARGLPIPSITLVDINRHMVLQGALRVMEAGAHDVIAEHQDLNKWSSSRSYDVILANQCLHHIVELEHLLDCVRAAMSPTGRFLISDVIGRNGHRLWPEARAALMPFWRQLPPSRRFDKTLGRIETDFVDHDHSMAAFEGIRCQDILRLLIERFDFGIFAPHSCITIPIVERRFGWNFSPNEASDRAFVDSLDEADQHGLASGSLKPTQLVAELGHSGRVSLTPIAPWANPAACIRDPLV
jgi:SAM-dependent methyltransferase